MKFRTFFWFVAPSVIMMLVFIAAPLVSVFLESFKVTRDVQQIVEVETCTPGFLAQTCVTEQKTVPVIDEATGKKLTSTEWVGLQSYRNVLQMDKVWAAIGAGQWREILQIDFWKALRFTLTFTLLTLPLVVGVGLAIALAVNNAAKSLRGPVIFVSLLPFIITPVIGSLSIYWL
ncbi:MAG: sugar ABC transporter permease, partial [Pseudomonadota bacterium]